MVKFIHNLMHIQRHTMCIRTEIDTWKTDRKTDMQHQTDRCTVYGDN